MELIDREKLQSTIRNMVELPNEVRAQVLGAISRAKAVDAKPVVHGRWLFREDEDGEWWDECSACGYQSKNHGGSLPGDTYCLNCGAIMDLPNITEQTENALRKLGEQVHSDEVDFDYNAED